MTARVLRRHRADEPTTALDVTIQGQILFEMQRLCRESNTALIWITHDLAVVAGLADRIAVMYAGRIVGNQQDILQKWLRRRDARHQHRSPAVSGYPTLIRH